MCRIVESVEDIIGAILTQTMVTPITIDDNLISMDIKRVHIIYTMHIRIYPFNIY